MLLFISTTALLKTEEGCGKDANWTQEGCRSDAVQTQRDAVQAHRMDSKCRRDADGSISYSLAHMIFIVFVSFIPWNGYTNIKSDCQRLKMLRTKALPVLSEWHARAAVCTRHSNNDMSRTRSDVVGGRQVAILLIGLDPSGILHLWCPTEADNSGSATLGCTPQCPATCDRVWWELNVTSFLTLVRCMKFALGSPRPSIFWRA